MKKKGTFIAVLLCVVCLLVPHIEAEKVEKPTKEDLFEQQMMIYETKRYIERNEQAKRDIEEELPLLASSIEEGKEEVSLQMEVVKPILLKMYGGEKSMWWELYLELETLEDILTVRHVSDTYTEKQMHALAELNNNIQNLEEEEKQLVKKQQELDDIAKGLEEQLKNLKQAESIYEKQWGLVDDVASARKEVEDLMNKWESDGLGSFRGLFQVMAKSIDNLPDMMNESSIKAKGLFTYEVTLHESDLNAFLQEENDLFADIAFRFEEDAMRMVGTYQGLSFDASGSYELVSEQEMQFSFAYLRFQGVKLPQVTLDEMAERYDLGFYPSEIVEGARIKGFHIKNGTLTVKVGL